MERGFSTQPTQSIETAFQQLGLEPTVDKQAILRTFRSAVEKAHPGTLQKEGDNCEARHRFITLAKDRDTLLAAIAHPASFECSPGIWEKPREIQEELSGDEEWRTAYEQEWEVLNLNKNAYFNLKTSTLASIYAVLLALGLGGVVSLFLGGWVLLVLVVGLVIGIMLLAMLTVSISIPLIGRVNLLVVLAMCPKAMRGVSSRLNRAVDASARSLLAQFVRTGHPLASFWFAMLLSAGLLILGAIALSASRWGFFLGLLVVFSIVVAGAMAAVYGRIGDDLARLSSALADIRRSSFYRSLATAHEQGAASVRGGQVQRAVPRISHK